jgi:hypothetical protein
MSEDCFLVIAYVIGIPAMVGFMLPRIGSLEDKSWDIVILSLVWPLTLIALLSARIFLKRQS